MSRSPQEGHNRILDAEDAALWAHVTAQVQPLAKGRTQRKIEKTPARDPAAGETRRIMIKTPPSDMPAPAPLSPASRERLPRTAERNLRRGSVDIGARLDLHGLDRAAAHRAVGQFLRALAEEGERVALIITGKGGARTGGEGVLRAEFPRWLSEGALARLVLAWRPAAPRHGGDGAFYVLLRRKARRS
jgi:DNA-nicking Smr family endonuclease